MKVKYLIEKLELLNDPEGELELVEDIYLEKGYCGDFLSLRLEGKDKENNNVYRIASYGVADSIYETV